MELQQLEKVGRAKLVERKGPQHLWARARSLMQAACTAVSCTQKTHLEKWIQCQDPVPNGLITLVLGSPKVKSASFVKSTSTRETVAMI